MTNRRAGPTTTTILLYNRITVISSRRGHGRKSILIVENIGRAIAMLASSLGMLANVMEGAGTCERGGALASILRTKIANLSDPSTSWYKFFFF
ncbi:hypothetical protein J6590_080390 [Homalodisca vitripennis]|nr:hypothetical protein J6590_080390 [Homalodisca vitripennis]